MRRTAGIVLVGLALLSFTACTTMQAIEDFSPSRIRSQVEVGDDVHIVTRKGAVYDVTVTRVQGDSLTGRSASGKLWQIQYEAIQHIEVEKADLIGTVSGTLATVYVAAGVIVTAAIISWSREDD